MLFAYCQRRCRGFGSSADRQRHGRGLGDRCTLPVLKPVITACSCVQSGWLGSGGFGHAQGLLAAGRNFGATLAPEMRKFLFGFVFWGRFDV